jgi:hypothetical protein
MPNLSGQGPVEVLEENIEIGEATSFGVLPNTADQLLKMSARDFVELSQFIEPLDKYSADREGEQRDMVGLAFWVHPVPPLKSHSAIYE